MIDRHAIDYLEYWENIFLDLPRLEMVGFISQSGRGKNPQRLVSIIVRFAELD